MLLKNVASVRGPFTVTVRTFSGNTTIFINSSDLISLMHANSYNLSIVKYSA